MSEHLHNAPSEEKDILQINSELLSAENSKDGVLEVAEGLVKEAIGEYDKGVLGSPELLEISDGILDHLVQVKDKLSVEEELSKAEGVSGYDSVVYPIARIFKDHSDDPDLTSEATIHRTQAVLQFKGHGQELAFNDFYNTHKHSDSLIPNGLSIEYAGPDVTEQYPARIMWKQPEFVKLAGERIAKDIAKSSENYSIKALIANLALENIFLVNGLSTEESASAKKFIEIPYMAGESTNDPAILDLGGAGISLRSGKELAARDVKQTFNVVSELIAHNPDTLKDINQAFKITHFGRYKTQPLIDQLDLYQGNTSKKPDTAIVSIAGRSDLHRAIGYHDTTEMVGEMDIDDQTPIYFESSSKADIARALITMKKMDIKISSLILNAHGYENSFVLGYAGQSNSELTIDDIKSSIAATRLRQKGILTDGADIILQSCSTGTDQGIGRALSETTKLPVIAPTKDLLYTKISSTPDGLTEISMVDHKSKKEKIIDAIGGLVFHYKMPDTKNYARTFDKGRVVPHRPRNLRD